jgi:type II secretory pathway component PulM
MSRKQILAIVAALLVLAGVYFKIPAPVVQAIEDVVAALVTDDAAQPTSNITNSDADAGAPGQ